LTLSIPRQPKVMTAARALARGGRGVEDSAFWSAAASVVGDGARRAGVVLKLPAPLPV
jgi:hypothetical protein